MEYLYTSPYTSTRQRYLPLPVVLLPLLVLVLAITMAGAAIRVVGLVDLGSSSSPAVDAVGPAPIALAFAPSVQHWAGDIQRWAAAYDLDPNLVATLIQIESCGDPAAVSRSGAQGLFQVMPFHFSAGELMLDPDTNARRGLDYLVGGLAIAEGDVGLALAGYNGGHSVIGRPSYTWKDETRRYFTWGTGIYSEVQANPAQSATLARWMDAGGRALCGQAEMSLGLE